MGVQTCVTSCAGELFVVLVRYVPPTFGLFKPLRQPEINHVDLLLLLAYANKEVVWLDVSVQEPL